MAASPLRRLTAHAADPRAIQRRQIGWFRLQNEHLSNQSPGERFCAESAPLGEVEKNLILDLQWGYGGVWGVCVFFFSHLNQSKPPVGRSWVDPGAIQGCFLIASVTICPGGSQDGMETG